MRRLLLRPTLLEFCRTHLIFTAAGALFTVLTGLVTTVFHLSETIMKAAPPDWSNASKTSLGTLPVLLPLLLCLAAYLPAGRLVRLRNGWARPEVPDALVLLLAPAAAFWVLVGLGALIPHGYGLTIAAALLNSPAYGLFTLYMVTTGWGITAPPWAGLRRGAGLRTAPAPPLPHRQLSPHPRAGRGGGKRGNIAGSSGQGPKGG